MKLLNFIKKYTNWHLKNLIKLFESRLHKMQEHSFVRLFNLMLTLKGKNDQIKYDTHLKRYLIENSKRKLIFQNKKQAVHSYKNGLNRRAAEIGQAYMLNEINFLEGDYVVDCGANVGDLLLFFELNKILINYIGIEPSPKEYSCLEENAKNHRTFNVGLWNEKIEKTFYLSSDDADSSLIPPANFDSKFKINCERLDNLQIDAPIIKLLKLEAEGAEPEVIEGAKNILNRIEFISADLGPERGKNNLETYSQVTNFLYKYNFSLLKINPGRLSILYKNNNF